MELKCTLCADIKIEGTVTQVLQLLTNKIFLKVTKITNQFCKAMGKNVNEKMLQNLVDLKLMRNMKTPPKKEYCIK